MVRLRRRTSDELQIFTLNFTKFAVLDVFIVLFVLVNIKKEPGGSKSSRYVFHLEQNN